MGFAKPTDEVHPVSGLQSAFLCGDRRVLVFGTGVSRL